MFTRERLTRWTKSLIANPDKQGSNKLADRNLTRCCCLGELCIVENIPYISYGFDTNFNFPTSDGYRHRSSVFLQGILRDEFGSDDGYFLRMKMPNLRYNGEYYPSASQANDAYVPWKIIAKHFDDWYQCSDEPSKENVPAYIEYSE